MLKCHINRGTGSKIKIQNFNKPFDINLSQINPIRGINPITAVSPIREPKTAVMGVRTVVGKSCFWRFLRLINAQLFLTSQVTIIVFQFLCLKITYSMLIFTKFTFNQIRQKTLFRCPGRQTSGICVKYTFLSMYWLIFRWLNCRFW